MPPMFVLRTNKPYKMLLEESRVCFTRKEKILLFLFIQFIFYFTCIGVLPAYMSVWGYQIVAIVCCPLGAGNRTWASLRAASVLNYRAIWLHFFFPLKYYKTKTVVPLQYNWSSMIPVGEIVWRHELPGKVGMQLNCRDRRGDLKTQGRRKRLVLNKLIKGRRILFLSPSDSGILQK